MDGGVLGLEGSLAIGGSLGGGLALETLGVSGALALDALGVVFRRGHGTRGRGRPARGLSDGREGRREISAAAAAELAEAERSWKRTVS